MLSLHCTQFPSSKDDLAQTLEKALRRFAQKPGPIVDLRSDAFPHLDEIAINFDGAQFDSLPPVPSPAVGATTPAFEATVLTMSARNISMRGVRADLRLEAQDVVFHKGANTDGETVLLVQKARDGQLAISASQLDLEDAIAQIGGSQARRQGITIDQVRLAMRARGARSLAADVRIQARKFLLRARIGVQAQLDIDDDFVAKISELKCRADGAIGSLACGALEPYLRQLEGRTLSLKSLPFSEVQLRDIRIAVADTVELTADFGSEG